MERRRDAEMGRHGEEEFDGEKATEGGSAVSKSYGETSAIPGEMRGGADSPRGGGTPPTKGKRIADKESNRKKL